MDAGLILATSPQVYNQHLLSATWSLVIKATALDLGACGAAMKPSTLGFRVYGTLGLYCIIIGDILGLYWDNGKENGNYYLGLRG